MEGELFLSVFIPFSLFSQTLLSICYYILLVRQSPPHQSKMLFLFVWGLQSENSSLPLFWRFLGFLFRPIICSLYFCCIQNFPFWYFCLGSTEVPNCIWKRGPGKHIPSWQWLRPSQALPTMMHGYLKMGNVSIWVTYPSRIISILHILFIKSVLLACPFRMWAS